MPELQKVIAETLRMWPAPPLFIRCALEEDQWPEGGTGIEGGCKLNRANDLFISTYNLGRSPQLWDEPDVFDPQRWDRPFKNDKVKGWKGYDPDKRPPGLWVQKLEIATDHAMMPFGAGPRKCVGDQVRVASQNGRLCAPPSGGRWPPASPRPLLALC